MVASAIIVFREVLEAALIIGIVLAASRGVGGRGRWIATGIAAGLCGALLLAAGADGVAAAFDGIGQEIVNAIILLLAVGMLGWHVVWMRRHGAELARHVRSVGGEDRPSALQWLAFCTTVTGIVALSRLVDAQANAARPQRSPNARSAASATSRPCSWTK